LGCHHLFDQLEVALGLSPSEWRKVPKRHRDIEASGFQKSRDLGLFKSRNIDEVLAVDLKVDTRQKIREETGFSILGILGTKKLLHQES
jgi:hypothetical protein